MGRGVRLASRERIIKEKEPIPTTMESRPSTRPSVRGTTTEGIGDEPVVRLTLQEVIQRTVANNKDVAVAGYEPAIDETRVVEAEARFDPTFFANVTYNESKNIEPSSSFIPQDPFNAQTFTTLSEQVGVRQNLFGGGQAELSVRNERIRIGQDLPNSVNPYYLNEI